MFIKVIGQTVFADGFQTFLERAEGAAGQGFAGFLFGQFNRLILGHDRKAGAAVGGGRQGEHLTHRGHSAQAVQPRNLIEENHAAIAQHGKVCRLAGLLGDFIQNHPTAFDDVEIRRLGKGPQFGSKPDAAALGVLNNEVLGRQSTCDSLYRRAGQFDP